MVDLDKIKIKVVLNRKYCLFYKMSYLGWKSWLGAEEGVGLELLMMMREARNRKSSNSCWIRDGPGNADKTHLAFTLTFLNSSSSGGEFSLFL